MTHYTDRPLGAARLAELEDLHQELAALCESLDEVVLLLAECRDLLDVLVSSQGDG